VKLNYKILLVVFLGAFTVLLNVPLGESVDSEYVEKALEDRNKIKDKAQKTFSHDNFYIRSLRYLSEEKDIKISVLHNKTTALDKILSRQSYELILKEGLDAEYLIEITVFSNLDYKIRNLSLRIA
jgi:hypothetical protein